MSLQFANIFGFSFWRGFFFRPSARGRSPLA